MLIQSIIDIAEIAYRKGIRYVVISPGSRNAHITIAFARHPEIKKFIIPDERAAAYIALGLAQSSLQPVALVCTSGTAVLNYYPAIAESYYQNIPLLVLTADRPAMWIDKNDGQTIRQTNVYANHIKKSFTFPENFEKEKATEEAQLIINEAINLSDQFPKGPVHVNIPINEPFYPLQNEVVSYSKNVILKVNDSKDKEKVILQKEFLDHLKEKKVAIVAGQSHKDHQLINAVSKISEEKDIPIFSGAISNIQFPGAIIYHDSFNFKMNPNLIPEVIISFGRSIISKKLKLALRNNKSLYHIHISENDYPADTYSSLQKVIHCSPVDFFTTLLEMNIETKPSYQSDLLKSNMEAGKKIHHFIKNLEFGEFKAFQMVKSAIPTGSVVHLSNSMPVRYFNLLGNESHEIEIFANRGTSGIDGCTSTAVGHALHNQKTNILFTGDMAFFYDRNALWHKHLPDNLKIVVFNNHGGGIFRLIDGPSQQPELEEYFETHQPLTAKNTAKDFNMSYYHCASEDELKKQLPLFIESKNAAILEIETNREINQSVFQEYKRTFS